MPAHPLPRWSLAVVCSLHAAVLAWAGATLPWRQLSAFTMIALLLAILHGACAITAALGATRWLARIWLLLALVSLAVLVAFGWALGSTAAYIAALYGSLGEGIAAGLLAVAGLVVLVTVPVAWWGLARTWPRGRFRRRHLLGGAGAVLLALVATLALHVAHALPQEVPLPGADVIRDDLRDLLGQPPGASLSRTPTLDAFRPFECEAPLDSRLTLLVAHAEAGTDRTRAVCLQAGSWKGLRTRLERLLGGDVRPVPIKLDLVVGHADLRPGSPLAEAFALRPGLDGVCHRRRCLAPWQLVAADVFTAHTPFPAVPDATLGISETALRKRLGDRAPAQGKGLDGLVRFATSSFAFVEREGLVPLRRIRPRHAEVTPDALDEATRLAEWHVAKAQLPRGIFRYVLDPFTGERVTGGFNMARQAGTTLATCELTRQRGRGRRVARRSLEFMARFEQREGNLSTIGPAGQPANLSNHALPLVALLACRALVDEDHDPLIARMARLVLAMQRPDGSFHAEYDLAKGRPYGSERPLFSEGQAVLALVLLEELLEQEELRGFPPVERVRAAAERAMGYFAGPYWDHALADFFYLEENWHCLAARAALRTHRHDGYERFCLDYVQFKRRLILDRDSNVAPQHVGGYGVGNIVPPHLTATAGYGEALAAAMAIRRVRGEQRQADRRTLQRVLAFLLRGQWTPANCFACKSNEALGGFSQHMASPHIRIDYVQHAWAALGHGGRMLFPPEDG